MLVDDLLVLGAGSAGLLAAVTLKQKLPALRVRVVRSSELGTIGVGEGTTPNFGRHLFEYLGLNPKAFYDHAEPTWKNGVRLKWGPRGSFDYGFSNALDARWSDLPLPNGYYCADDFTDVGAHQALMKRGKSCARLPDGSPNVNDFQGFHIENAKLIALLEKLCASLGVAFVEGKVAGAERHPDGRVATLVLEDGQKLAADFFIDSSGFRSELLGKALGEPFESFDKSLYCDRAVVGGWDRGADEPILPYTTAETMDGGWAWQIEHEHHVNRGYVFCSALMSDDDARAEFERKNPKAPKGGRVVKFRSGRYRRSWVENVVAIGNACGFVEPLEATALMVTCQQCRFLSQLLVHGGRFVTPAMRDVFNKVLGATWDDVRDFLALHYKFNTKLDTPFWRLCQEETDLATGAPLVELYREAGPTTLALSMLQGSQSQFGLEGYLVMLVGNRVPTKRPYVPTDQERAIFQRHRADLGRKAEQGYTVAEALRCIRHPNWRWAAGAAVQPAAASAHAA